MKQKSRYSGSLWVTYHTDHKIEGSESIASLCVKQCAYRNFCYSERMYRIMRAIREKAQENYSALTNRDGFEPPDFSSDIVRWFSLGSCNGDATTLKNVGESVKKNPAPQHAIWVEPWNWKLATRVLRGLPIALVWSHKQIDDVHVPASWYNSFNVMNSEESCGHVVERLRVNGIEPVICIGKCKECGWRCYEERGLTVLEIKRT